MFLKKILIVGAAALCLCGCSNADVRETAAAKVRETVKESQTEPIDTEGADQKQMPEETSKESAAAVSRIPEIEAEPADADQIQKESSEQKKEANPVWFSDAMLEQAGLTGLEPPEEYTTSLAHVRNQLYYIEPRVNETTKEIERSYIYYEGAPEYPVECVFFVPKKGYIEKSDNPSKTMRSGIDLMRTYKEGFYDFLREKGYTIYYLNNAFAQILVELKDEDLGRGRKPYNAREEGYSTGLGNESDYSNGDGNIGLDNIRELFYTNGSEGGAVRFKLNIYQGGTDFTMELYSLEAWEYLTDFTAEGCSGVRDLDTSSDGIRRQFEVLFDDSCTVRDVYVIVNNLDDTEHLYQVGNQLMQEGRTLYRNKAHETDQKLVFTMTDEERQKYVGSSLQQVTNEILAEYPTIGNARPSPSRWLYGWKTDEIIE